MNSIVCQANVQNHVPNKKLKIKSSVLTSATTKSPSASPSMMMYKQQQQPPTQPEESRYYNNRLAPAPLPPPPSSGLAIAPRLPSILPSSLAVTPTQHQLHQRPGEQSSPNHPAYLPRTQLAEQRRDYHPQQQVNSRISFAMCDVYTCSM